MTTRLQIDDLNIQFATRNGPVHALRGVSFDLGPERLGIVGESGSGKSTIGRAIMGLLPHTAQVTAKQFRLGDTDLLSASEKTFRSLRGGKVGLVMQDARYALNPVTSVGAQITEAFTLHQGLRGCAAKEAAIDLLAQVRIMDPATVFDQFPHQISGGMGQRVMIAIALAGAPDVLIADEPTSALDASVRARFLELLETLVSERNMALILISHDIDLVAGFCDRVLVMYGGQIMEECTAASLAAPQHPYTKGLIGCRPSLDETLKELRTFVRDPDWLEQKR